MRIHDEAVFLKDWHIGLPRADCNRDGVINTLDMLCVLNAWVEGCPF